MVEAKSNSVEIIPDRLYWISDKQPPRNKNNAYFFCIDNDLVYEPFFRDFGPLNLGMTYRFVTELEKLLDDGTYKKFRIFHYCSTDPAKRANAAYLICAFQVIIMGKDPEEAWAPFRRLSTPFVDYRDATFGACSYRCSILDCIRGIACAIKLGWFDVRNFNLRDYEFYERVENGDMNWIIPGKFLAFSGPSSTSRDPDGWRTFTPEDYGPLFKQMGIKTVIRLNKKQYDKDRFVKQGINHVDMYFVDGSCPSGDIINRFLEICERDSTGVAVHCKAGLGRTGTLIGLYAMKHFRFPAAAFIGWIRVSRPGSILGPQQQFLVEMQDKCFKWGEDAGVQIANTLGNLCLNEKKDTTMTADEKNRAVHGEFGQAEHLTDAKKRNSPSYKR